MHTKHQQKGVTAIGWIIILGLIGFFTLLTLKIVPIYIENFEVKSVLKSLKQEPGITRMSVRDIRKLIQKRFDINNIRTIDVSKTVDIQQGGGVTVVTVKYKVQQNMAGNLDVLIRFNNSIKIIAN
jgi:hypothetical protein